MHHNPLHRLKLALGIGKVRVTNDAGAVHTIQLQLSAAETRDATPQVIAFGFHSNAPAGSDVIYVSMGGDRGQAIAISTSHPGSRPRNIAQGGSVQHDQAGSQILLNNDGTVKIIAAKGTVAISGNVAVTGNLTVSGEVVAMSAGQPVHLSTHTHQHVQTGIGTSGAPTPGS